DAVIKERKSPQAVVPALISQEFADHVPKIIEELFKIHTKNNVINVHPTSSTSIATTTADLQQLYLKMKSDLQAQVADPELWDFLKRMFEKSSTSRNPNEPLRYLNNKDLFLLKYGNYEERKYVLSFHKIYVVPFLEEDLEENINCWARREFKSFKEEARLSIQHRKDS
nr:hypothetical protein [Tanacetum cinerariifolium]GFB04172.1 hypothetical protein [Tanacetum cinerariifolium]